MRSHSDSLPHSREPSKTCDNSASSMFWLHLRTASQIRIGALTCTPHAQHRLYLCTCVPRRQQQDIRCTVFSARRVVVLASCKQEYCSIKSLECGNLKSIEIFKGISSSTSNDLDHFHSLLLLLPYRNCCSQLATMGSVGLSPLTAILDMCLCSCANCHSH